MSLMRKSTDDSVSEYEQMEEEEEVVVIGERHGW